jgi:hypothetical protein
MSLFRFALVIVLCVLVYFFQDTELELSAPVTAFVCDDIHWSERCERFTVTVMSLFTANGFTAGKCTVIGLGDTNLPLVLETTFSGEGRSRVPGVAEGYLYCCIVTVMNEALECSSDYTHVRRLHAPTCALQTSAIEADSLRFSLASK